MPRATLVRLLVTLTLALAATGAVGCGGGDGDAGVGGGPTGAAGVSGGGPTGPTGPNGDCEPGYDPCVPSYPPDVDCPQIDGPVTVTGSDPHGLDADNDGSGCEV